SSSPSAHSGDSPTPMTFAPTLASAATNRRWLFGKAGSTNTMFTVGSLVAPPYPDLEQGLSSSAPGASSSRVECEQSEQRGCITRHPEASLCVRGGVSPRVLPRGLCGTPDSITKGQERTRSTVASGGRSGGVRATRLAGGVGCQLRPTQEGLSHENCES